MKQLKSKAWNNHSDMRWLDMAWTWEASITHWGHFSFTNIHISNLVKLTLAYDRAKPVTWPQTWHGKTPENPWSPQMWSVLSWLWRAELGSDSLCPRHTSPHWTADITSKHMGFQAAIPTMPGTQCWVSVVLGWTPHPDTWQTMLSWLCRNTGGFDVVHYCCDWLCGYRNVANLYLHLVVKTLLAFWWSLMDGQMFGSGIWRQMQYLSSIFYQVYRRT